MKFYKENDYTPENMAKHGINFDTMFEEIPIVLRNSHLVNALLCELSDRSKKEQKFSALDLGTRWVCFVFGFLFVFFFFNVDPGMRTLTDCVMYEKKKVELIV